MLFIGTQNELQEIPCDEYKPDLYLERISGEFLPVQHAFKSSNIYFVGTSRGCSCDFGIKSNQRNVSVFEKTVPIDHLINKFRKLRGTFDDWEKRHQEKVDKSMNDQAAYLTQTLKLVEIILNETRNGNAVELYCVWAGDYDVQPEFYNKVDTTKENIKENFEIAEREFTTFV